MLIKLAKIKEKAPSIKLIKQVIRHKQNNSPKWIIQGNI